MNVKKKKRKNEENEGRVRQEGRWPRRVTDENCSLFLSLSRDFTRLINYCKLKIDRRRIVDSRPRFARMAVKPQPVICTISSLSVRGIGCAPLNLLLVILSQLKVQVARLRRDSLSLAMIRHPEPFHCGTISSSSRKIETEEFTNIALVVAILCGKVCESGIPSEF